MDGKLSPSMQKASDAARKHKYDTSKYAVSNKDPEEEPEGFEGDFDITNTTPINLWSDCYARRGRSNAP